MECRSLRNTYKKNIQEIFINFKHSFFDQPTIASFTTPIEKNSHFFTFPTNKFKKPTGIKPNIGQTLRIRFTLKNSRTLLPKTENHEPLFAEKPQTNLLSKLKRYFCLMDFLLFIKKFWKFVISIN